MTPLEFEAMGTTVEVHGSSDTVNSVRSMFDRFERRLSRFLPDSELSWINRHRGRWVPVSSTMFHVLSLASEMRERTGGLVNIGVGSALAAWGYDRTFSDLPNLDRPPDRSADPCWEIGESRVFVDSHTQLDLGGIVKGWACDNVVEAGDAAVVSAGGDIRSTDASLVVEIADADGETATEVEIGVGALATSSTAKRRWRAGSREANHLIDPRTMSPSQSPIISASVVAETAVEAEAGAKAVLLHGVDGLAWADRQTWIRTAIVVWHDGSVYANGARMAS
ncbi:MAG: FAD:protein FMN transferase [Actinomycetota bacterium]